MRCNYFLCTSMFVEEVRRLRLTVPSGLQRDVPITETISTSSLKLYKDAIADVLQLAKMWYIQSVGGNCIACNGCSAVAVPSCGFYTLVWCGKW